MMQPTQINGEMDLYLAWSQDRESSAPTPLSRWIELYPDMAEQLMDWATGTLVSEKTITAEPTTEQIAEADAIGTRVVREIRAQYGASEPAPLTDLVRAIKARGLNVPQVVKEMGISLDMLNRLRMRLVSVSTIPASLVYHLADTLQVRAEQVRDYLRQQPGLAAGAAFKADGTPQAGEQEDFLTLVAKDNALSEEQKAFWQNSL